MMRRRRLLRPLPNAVINHDLKSSPCRRAFLERFLKDLLSCCWFAKKDRFSLLASRSTYRLVNTLHDAKWCRFIYIPHTNNISVMGATKKEEGNGFRSRSGNCDEEQTSQSSGYYNSQVLCCRVASASEWKCTDLGSPTRACHLVGRRSASSSDEDRRRDVESSDGFVNKLSNRVSGWSGCDNGHLYDPPSVSDRLHHHNLILV